MINKKKVYVGFAADILHEGHINILRRASKLGKVIVGLLTDKAITSYRKLPHLNYKQREIILKNIRFVDKVITQKTLDYTENLNLQSVGIEVDQNGFILTNNFNQTTINNIYAIGDCVPGPMLAHKASEEGILVAEKILGSKASIHIDNVPWIIYTWPEIAWVGQTEKSLKESGRNVRCGQFPFLASGRSHARGETEGFVKIIADRDNDQVLGVHIIGANASELISEAVTNSIFLEPDFE